MQDFSHILLALAFSLFTTLLNRDKYFVKKVLIKFL